MELSEADLRIWKHHKGVVQVIGGKHGPALYCYSASLQKLELKVLENNILMSSTG